MSQSTLELLAKVTVYDLIMAMMLILSILIVLASHKKRIMKWLNKWRTDKNKEEDFYALVYELRDSIKNLRNEVRQNQENRDAELLKYRNDSRKIRDEMYDVMRGQSESIIKLTEVTLEIQEKNSKTKRAEIKEKIERIYRECHPSKSCTDMQFETLKDLIEEYEEHGGDNSFVHTIVEQEMYDWEIRIKEE